MDPKEKIIVFIEEYLRRFPGEKERTTPLIQFLHKHQQYELIDRKNFTGHITTSAFIINDNKTALLLLKHKTLNRWLQPGGHVDPSDVSLLASALREACEETGFAKDHLTQLSETVFDVDSHQIPENIRKHEPAHIHHDIRYLFYCTDPVRLNISLDESTDSRWVSFADLEENKDFDWVGDKIKRFI